MAKQNVLDLLDKLNNTKDNIVDYVLLDNGKDKVVIKVDLNIDIAEAVRLNILDDTGIRVFNDINNLGIKYEDKIKDALVSIGVDISDKNSIEIEEIINGLDDSQVAKLNDVIDFNPSAEAEALRNNLMANYEMVKMCVKWQEFTNNFDNFWNRLTSEQRDNLIRFIMDERSKFSSRFQGAE